MFCFLPSQWLMFSVQIYPSVPSVPETGTLDLEDKYIICIIVILIFSFVFIEISTVIVVVYHL